ncbi:MAG: hypothetical protein NVS3B11_05460 [Collimonas sp.]
MQPHGSVALQRLDIEAELSYQMQDARIVRQGLADDLAGIWILTDIAGNILRWIKNTPEFQKLPYCETTASEPLATAFPESCKSLIEINVRLCYIP